MSVRILVRGQHSVNISFCWFDASRPTTKWRYFGRRRFDGHGEAPGRFSKTVPRSVLQTADLPRVMAGA